MENAVKRFEVDLLKVEIYSSAEAAAAAAAGAAAEALQRRAGEAENGAYVGAIFATGTTQIEVLRVLTSTPNIPWRRVIGFHLDEYVGIDKNHPASFRHYLKVNLTDRVDLHEFFSMDGSAPDPAKVCRTYAERLRGAEPQICLLGLGENGHLAFNDPSEANFEDPEDVKIVVLENASRQQQASEGWFRSLDEVPKRAITVTIPAIFRVPQLIVPIIGSRKAHILKRVLTETISTACPATILRRHRNATVYLDQAAAAELEM